MQYKNGRSASPGHYVVGKIGGVLVAGIVHSLAEKAKIVYPELGRSVFADVNLQDFYHVEDALSASELIQSGKVQPIVGATPTASTTPTPAA
jgi:hypothetical protein